MDRQLQSDLRLIGVRVRRVVRARENQDVRRRKYHAAKISATAPTPVIGTSYSNTAGNVTPSRNTRRSTTSKCRSRLSKVRTWSSGGMLAIGVTMPERITAGVDAGLAANDHRPNRVPETSIGGINAARIASDCSTADPGQVRMSSVPARRRLECISRAERHACDGADRVG